MTKEDRQLLLNDLSARLPYGVLCNMGLAYPLPLQRLFVDKLDGILLDFYEDGKDYQVYLGEVKPHLRPMSSMTEEEEDSLAELNCYYDNKGLYFSCGHSQNDICDVINFLNTHHFDYRGLIEKGLAIPVTKENNPYK